MSGSYSEQSSFPADSLFGAQSEPPAPARPSLVTRTAAAQARRDRALNDHERSENAAWRAIALDVVQTWLREHEELFPDDLWDVLPEPPKDRRVLGAVIQAAARKGWMVDSGTFRRSPSSNMSPKTVWRSRLYRRPAA